MKKGDQTGLVFDPVFLEHRPGFGHPESPARLQSLLRGLEESRLLSRLLPIAPRPVERRWLEKVHDASHVTRVEAACLGGAGYIDCLDTAVSGGSARAAFAAAGGVLAAIDAVMEGRAANAFCAVRPPGHHALRERAMGFCLFNNVAIGAAYLREKYRLERVFIIDWDVHHGNGTQDAFYDDPSVFFFSVHRYPFYPGTGAASERGAGPGEGATLNAPLPAGSGEAEYLEVFRRLLRPALRAFRPGFILVSAGFDAHRDDPLGGMGLDAESYGRMTRLVAREAAGLCAGRLVSVLEGGYDLPALAGSAVAHVTALESSDA